MKSMIEKKEDRVRKTPVSQVLIGTRIRNLEDHRVLVGLQLMDQLRLPIARLLYWNHLLLVHQEVHREDQLLLIAHIVRGNIKESVGD